MSTRLALRAFTGLGFLLTLCAGTLAFPVTAQAHGDTVKVEVTGQRDGHITTKITWEDDGDAVEETVAATVNATSPDGTRAMGPWRLVRDPGTRTGWSTAEVLTPGTWKVTVDVGFPSLGHGEGEIAVPVVDPLPPGGTTPPVTGPAPTPTESAPVPSAPAPASATPSSASPGPSSSAAGDGADRTVWWSVIGLAGISLAAVAAGLLLRKARAGRT
ncbi:YbaB/EbfC family nucleoid-associated protein [Streptomyces sp. NPDC048577]|uniref:YbaB/EbfC family nucleoid-associated protein n=1 Tax=Streptomyces sp. NPDC048577 TaxID=3157209 RepID=UPI0034342DF4